MKESHPMLDAVIDEVDIQHGRRIRIGDRGDGAG
jgi:hypothetical protein